MFSRNLIIILFIAFGIFLFLEKADASCDVDEIIYYVRERHYNYDQIRNRCRNTINDVKECGLSKVLQLIREGLNREQIYERCGKKRKP
jgi:hypothetical protein